MIPKKQLVASVLIAGGIVIGLSELSLGESTGINILIVNKGEVKIKKENWKAFQKASTGSLLRPNDYLQMGSNASAFLLCSNTERWQPTAGKQFRVSEGCPRGTASRPRKVARGQTRGQNALTPYIISPRNTDLLSDRPLLKWNPVTGATRYQVKLQGGGLDWQTETNETQVLYGGQEPLKLGVKYLLIVTTTTDKEASSKKEVGADLMFGLMTTEKAKVVKEEATNLKKQGLSPEAETLALAYLYEGNNLKAEAIALLQPLSQQKSQNRVVYSLLGDLLLQTNLNQQAQQAYEQALALAQKSGDQEGEAEAQSGLGEASFGLGKKEEALSWLKKAQASYGALGDESQAQVLAQRIEKIQK
jgi:predicted negative regulator of RcsB-dependent stress response